MSDKYYVIGLANSANGGLFALFANAVSFIIYAKSINCIPVVDLKNFDNQYFKDDRKFKDNVWEYFFKQPANIGLDDIPPNAECIVANEEEYISTQKIYLPEEKKQRDILDLILLPCDLPIDKHCKIKKNPQYMLSFLNFSDEMQSYLENEYSKIIGDENEILGILLRGTDYTKLKPKGHHVQPSLSVVIDKAKKLLKKYHYKKIWLATEDEDIYNTFKAEFGDLLLDNKQYKYNYSPNNGKYLAEIKVNRENHHYNLAKEYLLSLYILSKCKYFIGGRTAGTVAVYLMSDCFKHQKYFYIWSLGVYKYVKKVQYKNFLEWIFSFKKECNEDKNYKVITIFGIKIKIRVKFN